MERSEIPSGLLLSSFYPHVLAWQEPRLPIEKLIQKEHHSESDIGPVQPFVSVCSANYAGTTIEAADRIIGWAGWE